MKMNENLFMAEKHDKKIYEQCGIRMYPDDKKLLADRIAGGASKWDELQTHEQKLYTKLHLPSSDRYEAVQGPPPNGTNLPPGPVYSSPPLAITVQKPPVIPKTSSPMKWGKTENDTRLSKSQTQPPPGLEPDPKKAKVDTDVKVNKDAKVDTEMKVDTKAKVDTDVRRAIDKWEELLSNNRKRTQYDVPESTKRNKENETRLEDNNNPSASSSRVELPWNPPQQLQSGDNTDSTPRRVPMAIPDRHIDNKPTRPTEVSQPKIVDITDEWEEDNRPQNEQFNPESAQVNIDEEDPPLLMSSPADNGKDDSIRDPNEVLYFNAGRHDPLYGYGIGLDGRMYNPMGQALVNGFNLTEERMENDVRRDGPNLPPIEDYDKTMIHKLNLAIGKFSREKNPESKLLVRKLNLALTAFQHELAEQKRIMAEMEAKRVENEKRRLENAEHANRSRERSRSANRNSNNNDSTIVETQNQPVSEPTPSNEPTENTDRL